MSWGCVQDAPQGLQADSVKGQGCSAPPRGRAWAWALGERPGDRDTHSCDSHPASHLPSAPPGGLALRPMWPHQRPARLLLGSGSRPAAMQPRKGPRAPAICNHLGLSLPFWTSVPPAPTPCCKDRQRGPQGHFGWNTWVLGCLRLHLPLHWLRAQLEGRAGARQFDRPAGSQEVTDGGRQAL